MFIKEGLATSPIFTVIIVINLKHNFIYEGANPSGARKPTIIRPGRRPNTSTQNHSDTVSLVSKVSFSLNYTEQLFDAIYY